jgi:hypothetical protein
VFHAPFERLSGIAIKPRLVWAKASESHQGDTMNLHRFVAAAVCWALIGTPAFSQKITDDKIRVGVLTDMAGPYQDTGGMGSVEAARMVIGTLAERYSAEASDWSVVITKTRQTSA